MVSGAFCCNKCYNVYTLPHKAEDLPTKMKCSKCGSVQKPRSEYRNAVKSQATQPDPKVKDAIRQEILATFLYNLATGKYGRTGSGLPRRRLEKPNFSSKRYELGFSSVLSAVLRRK